MGRYQRQGVWGVPQEPDRAIEHAVPGENLRANLCAQLLFGRGLRELQLGQPAFPTVHLPFDAELVRSAFRLVRESGRAVLVARDDSPLHGAMYPTHALPRHMLPDSENARGPRRNATKNGVLDNARVLVVREILSDPELDALLAHELAHAITMPVWQTENNRPPAFTEFETVTANALISARKRSAPSPPRSAPRRASSSLRAGTRRSR